MSKEGLETPPPSPNTFAISSGPLDKAVTKQLQPRVSLFCCFMMKVFPTATPGGMCPHRRHTDTHCCGLGPTLSGCSVPSTALLHSFIFSFILLKSEGYLMPCSCWTTREGKRETPLMSLYNSNAEKEVCLLMHLHKMHINIVDAVFWKALQMKVYVQNTLQLLTKNNVSKELKTMHILWAL